jgi:hypothetical protein
VRIESCLLIGRELLRAARARMVVESVRAFGIEALGSILQGSAFHPGQPQRLGSGHAFQCKHRSRFSVNHAKHAIANASQQCSERIKILKVSHPTAAIEDARRDRTLRSKKRRIHIPSQGKVRHCCY